MQIIVIAEIGWNHMGDMDLAKKMVVAAKESGADFAKFQTWSVKNLKSGPWDTDGRLDIYKQAELTQEQHRDLADFCGGVGIRFLTSVFNIKDVAWLPGISDEAIKVPSHEVHNAALMKALDGQFKRVFVSTGAASWDEVRNIPNVFSQSNLTLLHCVSAYPCPAERVNLPRMTSLRELCGSVGYSGHYFGTDDAIAAMGMGATVIEKHFTLDRDLPGRDNKFAILPDDMKKICEFRDAFQQMNVSLGESSQDCEQDIIDTYRGRWSA